MLKNVLITCFSIAVYLVISGCSHARLSPVSASLWQIPEKPVLEKINGFEKIDGGFFISDKDAETLVNNIDELKAYVEKLEATINKMRDYYR